MCSRVAGRDDVQDHGGSQIFSEFFLPFSSDSHLLPKNRAESASAYSIKRDNELKSVSLLSGYFAQRMPV